MGTIIAWCIAGFLGLLFISALRILVRQGEAELVMFSALIENVRFQFTILEAYVVHKTECRSKDSVGRQADVEAVIQRLNELYGSLSFQMGYARIRQLATRNMRCRDLIRLMSDRERTLHANIRSFSSNLKLPQAVWGDEVFWRL
jgi:hypothetical protein